MVPFYLCVAAFTALLELTNGVGADTGTPGPLTWFFLAFAALCALLDLFARIAEAHDKARKETEASEARGYRRTLSGTFRLP